MEFQGFMATRATGRARGAGSAARGERRATEQVDARAAWRPCARFPGARPGRQDAPDPPACPGAKVHCILASGQ
eukprot:8146159-Lingulodinium_polyedra.AAC.1